MLTGNNKIVKITVSDSISFKPREIFCGGKAGAVPVLVLRPCLSVNHCSPSTSQPLM